MNTINGRTPEEIKKGLECCKPVWVDNHWKSCNTKCPYIDDVRGFCREMLMVDALTYIQQLERERDAAVRTARWQFERRDKDGMTKLPVCSGCGATPKYYAPMNDVGMQVPPYCHECGSRMAPVVKLEVEK